MEEIKTDQNQAIQNLQPQSDSIQQTTKPIKKKSFLLIFIILLIIVVVGFSWYIYTKRSQSSQKTQATLPSTEKGILRVGENIDEAGLAEDTKEFQPFIDYLVANLHQYGYTKGVFVGTHSVSEMAQLVREHKIDIVIDSAFPVYVVGKLAGAQVIADRWKGGVGTYHSAIFVKKESTINTTSDLKGKMLAFDSNTSTVGYFLPKAELIKEGYTLTQKTKPTDLCTSNEICYTFVHGSVYETVAKGVVPAGAESELEIDGYFGDKIKNYRIVSRSPDISRFLVATRGDMDIKQINSIKSILFTLDQTKQGRNTLSAFAATAKFTSVANNDTSYGVIKDLSSIVEDEIIKQ
ncbi:MAG TPA: PhnD/SsuA/transferrin family substrate-binding protein [Candidatus Sulfotelmatobacter sp.]|jgi:phosphonate transport system substrate-binding protein|nr:PhnD/SsuA/transferrin family substrate-binding protein [Candidatus Sulfotelmatobacter sp.]